MIDLDAYLRRTGLPDVPRPDLASLEALHLAHLAAIPFENVDVRLGRPIRLDLDSLMEKLVARRRGGYCFEQNTLFAAVLRALDYEVDTLEARVRPPNATVTLPRTHMTLRVAVDGDHYLADVGFGGTGPPGPVPLDGTVSQQADGLYAVRSESDQVLVLRRQVDGAWHDLYAFGLTPALPVDFEVASHYTATYASSPFLNVLTAQRTEASGRYILRGRTYTERSGGRESVREIGSAEVGTLLRERFGIDVSDEEAREALGDAPPPA